VLGHKFQALRQRIWMIATLSAGANVIPIPGLSVACDFALLENEIRHYKTILALDTESLLSLVDQHNVIIDELRTSYKTLDDKNYYQLLFGKELV
jgi:hypothetical protein